MIEALANRETYRFLPVNDNLVLEFDYELIDTVTDLADFGRKQVIVSDSLDVSYEDMHDLAISKMAEWEIANSNTGE